MADISQISFSLSEIATGLIKQQNLHDGKWYVSFEFGLAAAHVPTSPTEVKPAAILTIMNINLQRVREGEPTLPFQVDASEVNPL